MRCFGTLADGSRYVALIAALLALAFTACSSPAEFHGTQLNPARSASPFDLQNQTGQRVTLADYQGRAVLLTFLYTNCPDVCPIVTSQLRDAHDLLGDDAEGVAFVSISVDPERDSVQAAREFTERWGVSEYWDFLVGPREELEPIWRAYFVDPAVSHREDGDSDALIGGGPASGGVGVLRDRVAERYLVIHSAPVFMIDPEGIMRAVTTSPFEPQALADDVRLMLDR